MSLSVLDLKEAHNYEQPNPDRYGQEHQIVRVPYMTNHQTEREKRTPGDSSSGSWFMKTQTCPRCCYFRDFYENLVRVRKHPQETTLIPIPQETPFIQDNTTERTD